MIGKSVYRCLMACLNAPVSFRTIKQLNNYKLNSTKLKIQTSINKFKNCYQCKQARGAMTAQKKQI